MMINPLAIATGPYSLNVTISTAMHRGLSRLSQTYAGVPLATLCRQAFFDASRDRHRRFIRTSCKGGQQLSVKLSRELYLSVKGETGRWSKGGHVNQDAWARWAIARMLREKRMIKKGESTDSRRRITPLPFVHREPTADRQYCCQCNRWVLARVGEEWVQRPSYGKALETGHLCALCEGEEQ